MLTDEDRRRLASMDRAKDPQALGRAVVSLRVSSTHGHGANLSAVETAAVLAEIDRLRERQSSADMCLDAVHEARRVLREHFGGNLAFLDDDLMRGVVKMKEEIDRLTRERDEIAARLESAVDALTHKRPLMTTAKTVDDWRRIAEHLDFEWSECSRHLNKVAAQRDEARAERDALRDVLLRHGFVPCDIPACNCGSWHARFGYPERLREIADALDEAGHPLSNENGNMPLNALRELIAERDALAKERLAKDAEAR